MRYASEISVVIAATLFGTLFVSCRSSQSSSPAEVTVVDVKQEIWERTKRNRVANVDKVREIKLKSAIAISRPTSFAIDADGTIFLNDNYNGKLLKLSSDFNSISDVSSVKLSRPLLVKTSEGRVFVYDESGINIFDTDGQIVETIKPFLRIEDIAVVSKDRYIVTLSEIKADVDPNHIAILDSQGKRNASFGTAAQTRSVKYPQIENKAYLEVRGEKVFVCYKYEPVCEIYEFGSMNLITSFRISDVSFPALFELKKDSSFVNPEPGKFRVPKFVAGFKVYEKQIFVLLDTPSPEIVEFDLLGKEVNRYVTSDSQIISYFGFDIQLIGNTKHFFVGATDGSNSPSLAVYRDSSRQ